jgi:hypothetical protein
MYGIFTYIWVISNANVGKYSIHGAYGYHTILQICKKVGVFLGLTKNKTTKIIYKDNYVPTKGRMQRLFNQQKKGIKKKHNTGSFPEKLQHLLLRHVVLNVLHVFQGMTSAQRLWIKVDRWYQWYRYGHPSHGNSMT